MPQQIYVAQTGPSRFTAWDHEYPSHVFVSLVSAEEALGLLVTAEKIEHVELIQILVEEENNTLEETTR